MRQVRFLVALVVMIAAAVPVGAAKPRRWVVSSAEDFLAGEFEGASVTSDGRLLPAPALELVLDTEQPLIHAAVADKSGNLFVATGNSGKIFRIPPRGSGEEWADLEETGVFALAVDSQNRLYAGTSPGGKVYRITGKGRSEEFFDTDAKYLWDLVVDERDNLYVATGPRGQIFRVDPQGAGRVFYDSSESHIISLARDLEGRLVAGTSPGGQLIRIDEAGKAFVLFDSSMDEMRGLASDRYGNLYAAGLSFQDSKTAAAAKSAATALKKDSGDDDDQEETITVAGSRKGKALEIYRLDRDGLAQTIYSADGELAFDLSLRDDGSVLAATSQKGRVLAISANRMVRLVAQTPDDQVTALLNVEGTLYVCTSNLGKVYRLSAVSGERGTYLSKPLDAGLTARWGMLRWALDSPQGTPPQLRTRSGNTEKPDATWSDWSEPLTEASGSQIASPPARYLQWKAEFSRAAGTGGVLTDANGIRRVEVNYLQRNVAPVVEKLTVLPPGAALVKLPVAANPASVALGGPDDAHLYALPDTVRQLGKAALTPPPQRVFVPGARSITWEAEDANDDDLVYALSVRLTDDKTWTPVASDLSDTFHTIDGASFPPGLYQVKVEASDRLSNPSELALTGELASAPFVLSSTPPRLEVQPARVEGKTARMQARASSDGSTIYQVEYALDGKSWTLVFPQDGIADSPEETFQWQLEDLASGDHVVSLRVVDAVGNLGTARVTFRIP